MTDVFQSLNTLFNVDGPIGLEEGMWYDWTSVGGFKNKKHTEESKRLMSQKRLTWLEKNEPHRHTDETKRLLAQKSTGVKQSSQTIARRVEKNRGQKRSPEQRKRLSEGCRHNPIVFISPEGKEVSTTLVSEFCREYNLTHSLITKVIKGTRQTHKGWRIK